MGGADVQLRGAKYTLSGQIDIRPLSCTIDHPDICDRADRQLGIAGRNWTLNSSTDSVTVVNTSSPTTPISDFNQALSVDRMQSSTHTFNATGNFKLSSIEASASGSMKIEIKAGNNGSETTKMIAFTSPSNPITQLKFNEELQLTSGQRILVIRTNRENVAMDVFSTILGFNS